jgi:hypothetical protein
VELSQEEKLFYISRPAGQILQDDAIKLLPRLQRKELLTLKISVANLPYCLFYLS